MHDFDFDTSAWFKDHDRIRVALEKAGFERVRHYYLKNCVPDFPVVERPNLQEYTYEEMPACAFLKIGYI